MRFLPKPTQYHVSINVWARITGTSLPQFYKPVVTPTPTAVSEKLFARAALRRQRQGAKRVRAYARCLAGNASLLTHDATQYRVANKLLVDRLWVLKHAYQSQIN